MAVALRRQSASPPELAWAPQAGPQEAFVNCPLSDVVYGGARGGGKTDAAVGEWAIHAERYGADAKGLIVRKTQIALEKTIERAKQVYRGLATWQESKRRFMWNNGATIYYRYLERDEDADAYQGHDYTRVYVEELTQFANPSAVDKLRATLRSAAGVPTGFRATCNPGGPGHTWVKARYIDPGPWRPMPRSFTCPFTQREIKTTQIFIPAKLSDNPTLLMNDPAYVANLYQAGSEQLVRAWLEGDWDILEGAYFTEWRAAKHVVRPFAIPSHWLRCRAFDWGSASPFSVGWWAVASEDHTLDDGRVIPRGALVRYREWYGAAKDANGQTVPNQGLKLTNTAIAEGVVERETRAGNREKITIAVADPSIFATKGGPSIADEMGKAGCYWNRADNTRVARDGPISGWGQMRQRLVGVDDRPMLYVFDTCRDFIRTVPALQHDPKHAEDIDTSSEDHIADETRYMCMARPWAAPPPPAEKPRDRYREAQRVQTKRARWAI